MKNNQKIQTKEQLSKYEEACLSKGGNGAILFSVCRGKYTEGANFKGDLCRGLFIIGVPNRNL